MGEGTKKLQAQLDAAHEVIDVLRAENARLWSGVRDVLRFHDDCLCRHGRKYLQAAAIEAGIDGKKAAYGPTNSETANALIEATRSADPTLEKPNDR